MQRNSFSSYKDDKLQQPAPLEEFTPCRRRLRAKTDREGPDVAFSPGIKVEASSEERKLLWLHSHYDNGDHYRGLVLQS